MRAVVNPSRLTLPGRNGSPVEDEVTALKRALAAVTIERDQWKTEAEGAQRSLKASEKHAAELQREILKINTPPVTTIENQQTRIELLEAEKHVLLSKVTELSQEVLKLDLIAKTMEKVNQRAKQVFCCEKAKNRKLVVEACDKNKEIYFLKAELKSLQKYLEHEKTLREPWKVAWRRAQEEIQYLKLELDEKIEPTRPFMTLEEVLVRLPESSAHTGVFVFPVKFKIDVDDFESVKKASKWHQSQLRESERLQAWYDSYKMSGRISLLEECVNSKVEYTTKEWWTDSDSSSDY